MPSFLRPLLALASGAVVAACGSSTSSPADGASDAYVPPAQDASADASDDVPFIQEAAVVSSCKLSGDADPVGLCVQRAALADLHAHAFAASRGAAASWNSTTDVVDTGEAGTVLYSVEDTLAYAAAAAGYLASAEVYGDTTLTAPLAADLQAVALQLETSFALSPTEYSGEPYFHLRAVAAGLRAIQLNSDGAKFDLLAETYGRGILTAHFTDLGMEALQPDAGDAATPAEAGADAASEGGGDASGDASGLPDATTSGPADASASDATVSDAGAPDAVVSDAGSFLADGVIGNPMTSGDIAYAPADVATASYALLDLVSRNPADPLVPAWLHAARVSLAHVRTRAAEPTTGMLYRALVATRLAGGGSVDVVAPSSDPALPPDALLADTQATYALALVRAQYLVTSNTVAMLGGVDGSGPIVDAGVSGPFVPILDIPFESWADAAIAAMNGPHSLWDGVPKQAGLGYLDGYLPSQGVFLDTKSTRPNALMAAAIERAFVNSDPTFEWQRQSLVQLLIAQASATVSLHSNLITIIPMQTAYFRQVTRAFAPVDSGKYPLSYTTAAVSAAVEGLNEQLFGRSP
jgi:hypothetical protein